MNKFILGIIFGTLFLLTSLSCIGIVIKESNNDSKAFEDKVGYCVGSALVPMLFLGLTIRVVSKKQDAPVPQKIREDENSNSD